MTQLVRRSWLLIPATDQDLIEGSWEAGADVIVLDLEDLVHDSRKFEARARIQEGIGHARKGGAEVFVRCDLELLYADLEASVCRGLEGIILPKVHSIAQVREAEETLARFEAQRGVMKAGLIGEVNEIDEPRNVENSLEIQLSLEDAEGNYEAINLLQASHRIRSVSLGRADLVMDLRAEPTGELHLLNYLMQRLVIVANTAGVTPIGAWWQGNSRGMQASPNDTLASAQLGRAVGFKGALCVSPEQVRPLNQGFTPSREEVAQARSWLDARSDGKPYAEVDGVLVDEALAGAAQRVLDWAAACAERDRFKEEAVKRA